MAFWMPFYGFCNGFRKPCSVETFLRPQQNVQDLHRAAMYTNQGCSADNALHLGYRHICHWAVQLHSPGPVQSFPSQLGDLQQHDCVGLHDLGSMCRCRLALRHIQPQQMHHNHLHSGSDTRPASKLRVLLCVVAHILLARNSNICK